VRAVADDTAHVLMSDVYYISMQYRILQSISYTYWEREKVEGRHKRSSKRKEEKKKRIMQKTLAIRQKYATE